MNKKDNYDKTCLKDETEESVIKLFTRFNREITTCRQCFDYIFNEHYDFCCQKRFEKDFNKLPLPTLTFISLCP